MSFDGTLFKSYSTGIARLISHKGKHAVILNDRGFSSTTGKHMSNVLRAIPSEVPRFSISEGYGARLNVTPKEIFSYWMEQAKGHLANSLKPRVKKEKWEGMAGRCMSEANRVAEFFGLRSRASAATVARLAASQAKEEARQEKERAKREAQAREKLAEDYEAWKRGENVYTSLSIMPVAFRVEGDEVVSTLGARVPLHDARKALRFIKSRKGQEWRENGETCPVGGYRVNSITPAGIIAG